MSDITEEETARFAKATRARTFNALTMDEHIDLVRAVLALLQPALERARREERERCAKVAENQFCPDPDIEDACRQIAAAIRKG